MEKKKRYLITNDEAMQFIKSNDIGVMSNK